MDSGLGAFYFYLDFELRMRIVVSVAWRTEHGVRPGLAWIKSHSYPLSLATARRRQALLPIGVSAVMSTVVL